MTFIKQIPIPIAGLILAIVSMGNYLIQQHQFMMLGNTLLWIAIIFIILLTLRVITDFTAIKKDFRNPIIASVAPTFTMATFGIAFYLYGFPHLELLSTVLWYAAIVLHLAFIAYFTFQFVIKRDLTLSSLYPSWFITYIGIGVITLTSPSFNLVIGQVFLAIAMLNYIILIPLMIYRLFKAAYNEKPALPLLTIIAAPTSLCLAGYLTVVEQPNLIFVGIVLLISQTLYAVALYFISNMWKLSFYPSFAAFTFPLVITFIAATLANQALQIPYLNILITIEGIIAAAVTSFVFVRYIYFLYKATAKEKAIAAREITE